MMKLTKKYKSGSALEILQEAILAADVEPGSSLTQVELAESLGVSRMPVRESLIALEYQGLVVKHTNQHVNIAPLTDGEIRAVFTDLAVLECEVLRSLPVEKAALLSSCSSQEEFHEMLCRNAGSLFRQKTLGVLTRIYASFVLTHSDDRSRLDAVFENLREALTDPKDTEVIRAVYAVYSEVMANELIHIRRNRHVEREAG